METGTSTLATRRGFIARLAAASSTSGALAALACGDIGQQASTAGSSAAPAKTRRTGVTLSIVTSIPASAMDDFNKVLADFASRQPGWTAEYQQGNIARVLTMIAGGTAPDITSTSAADLAALSMRNQLLQLNPLIQRDRYDLRDYFERAIKQWQWEGKQTGLPRGYANQVLFYNLDLFERAGRKAPPSDWNSAAWTWNDFLADARALTNTAENGKQGHFGYGMWPGLRFTYGLFVWNAGGDILSTDGRTCVIDRPEAVEGLQFMADLVTRHQVAPPMAIAQDEQTDQMFYKGRVAMHVFTSGAMQRHQTGVTNFRWEVGVTPKGRAARQTTGGGTGWAIPAETRNPDEAWPLLQHLLNPESQKTQAGFFYPSRKSIAEWFAQTDSHLPPKNRKTVFEAGNHSRTDPVHPKWGDVDRIVQAELTPLLAGTASAREAATKIKQQADAVLAS
jgi:multiple sugar transport system substrate-binding protein